MRFIKFWNLLMNKVQFFKKQNLIKAKVKCHIHIKNKLQWTTRLIHNQGPFVSRKTRKSPLFNPGSQEQMPQEPLKVETKHALGATRCQLQQIWGQGGALKKWRSSLIVSWNMVLKNFESSLIQISLQVSKNSELIAKEYWLFYITTNFRIELWSMWLLFTNR